MPDRATLPTQGIRTERAQAMVEFAIVAPILFLMLFGVIEVGRMMFLYAAVTNASREAVRWGSAVGYDDVSGILRYKNCQRIAEIAQNAAFSPDAAVEIFYDTGPGDPVPDECDITSTYPGYRESGDRIMVKVTVTYKPYTKLIPWGERDFESISYRTILGYIALPSTSVPSGGGTDTPTPTITPTETAGPSPTPTDTATPTATSDGVLLPSPTPTPTETAGPSPTPTDTPTEEPTSTPTLTPTPTPTVVAGCSGITAGSLLISYNYMAMNIVNPHEPITVSSIQVRWHTSGAPSQSQNSLSLKSASLENLFWTDTDTSGNLIIDIVPNSLVTIPGNGTESTVVFTFDQIYENPNGNEEIVITLSDPCPGIIVRSPLSP
jgi:hypothetical protein